MKLDELIRYFYDLFIGLGWSESMATTANSILNIIILLGLTILLNNTLRKIFRSTLSRIAARTKTKFDDFLFQNKTVARFANLLTLLFLKWFLPRVLTDFEYIQDGVVTILDILTTIIVIWLLRSLLLTFKDFLKTLNSFKDKPIESYVQVVMIFIWFFGFILIFSLLTGRSVWQFLTTLGALSAIILLIFKDTILGFVASIQVSVNDTVRIGDWITMEKYGADGDVTEINLASVKVRNFDNTITTIPTYYLISDSFKNWREMSVSGGRRIKRSVIIKSTSIHFISEDELNSFKKIQLITDYLENRQQDIDKYNQERQINKDLLINGRNMTNFGVFRKYVDSYLNQHPAINKEMLMMSRQLEPTAQGIPLEIYAFSKDKVWQNYEHIIADIFDHLLSAIPYFNLELYELPTGNDFKELNSK